MRLMKMKIVGERKLDSVPKKQSWNYNRVFLHGKTAYRVKIHVSQP